MIYKYLLALLIAVQVFIFAQTDVDFKLNYDKKFDRIQLNLRKAVQRKVDGKFREASDDFISIIKEINQIIRSIEKETGRMDDSQLNFAIADDIKFIDMETECARRINTAKNLYIVGLFQESYEFLAIVKKILLKAINFLEGAIKPEEAPPAEDIPEIRRSPVSNLLEVSLLSPGDGWLTNDIVVFSGTALDPFGEIQQVTVSIGGGPAQVADGTTNWRLENSLGTAAGGRIEVSVTASNDFQMLRTESWTFGIDQSAPRISCFSPAADADVSGTVVFKGSAADTESGIRELSYRLPGKREWYSLPPVTDWYISLYTADMAAGPFVMELKAINGAGLTAVQKIYNNIVRAESVSVLTETASAGSPPEPAPERALSPSAADRVADSGRYRLSNIYFKLDSAKLNDFAKEKLAHIAALIRKNKYSSLVLEGHTDDSGNDEYNVMLSLRRAQAVKRFLNSRYGIPLKRIKIKPFGSAHPVKDNTSPRYRALNRRVEFYLIK